MQKYQQRVVVALRRGRLFLSTYAGRIGPDEVGPAVAELDAAVAAIYADANEKSEARQEAKSGTRSKNVLRERLRRLMGPVAAIAEGGLVGVPVAEMTSFRLPDDATSDVALIVAARAMATSSAKRREAFEAYGRPAGFVEDIESAALAFEQRIIQRDGDRISKRRARLGIGVNLRKARTLLTILTRVVTNKLFDRPDLIDAWRTAIRVGRSGGPPQGSGDEAAPETGPVSGPVAGVVAGAASGVVPGPVLVNGAARKAA